MELSKIACGLSEVHLETYQNTLIHKDIKTPLCNLITDAAKYGFDIKIASAYRGFDRQALIWNSKFLGKTPILNKDNQVVKSHMLSGVELCEAILLFSAMPGASRHHYGTDLDIFDANALLDGKKLHLEPWEYQKNGPFYKLSQWLDKHIADYGFFKPYAEYTGGIAQEPWHISHQKTATELLNNHSKNSISDALQSSSVEGKQCLIDNIDVFYDRYVLNIS